MATLDVFKTNEAFTMRSLTDAVNKMPYLPGRLGALGLFEEQGVATTTIMVEERDGVLSLIPTTAYGAPATQLSVNKRTARALNIPHLALEHTLYAAECQNVRAFGSESALEGVQTLVNQRFADMVASMDATLEYLRIGAVKGTIVDADGGTIYNLFTEFGVSQESEVDFSFDDVSAKSLVGLCNGIVRAIQDNLGGTQVPAIRAICDSTFWDNFVGNTHVRAAFDRYLTTTAAFQSWAGQTFGTAGLVRKPPFDFCGIQWEEYRGSVGSTSFIASGKAHFFPVGVPGLFRLYYAPADFAETVNTLGLPRYARQATDDEFNRWVKLHLQSNPLPLCTRPKVLMYGKAN